MTDSQPLVSIVTPMYNGEKYLRECIESVLAQTYDNWEYVIVNNCSKDNSLAICKEYAAHDSRIKIINNKDFLGAIQNQNNSLRLISPESKYCKIVHTDDWIFPECIERMVEIAEQDPEIGVVTSYVLSNVGLFGFGIPYTDTITSGSTPCRLLLLEDKYLFGNATSQLIRSDLIRARHDFYEAPYMNCDQIVLLDLLKDCKFGFAHQFLAFMRNHDEQNSAFTTRCIASSLDRYVLLAKHGTNYLNPEELQYCMKKAEREYYLQAGENFFKIKKKECLDYHRECLEKAGLQIDQTKLVIGFLKASINLIFNPRKTARTIKSNLGMYK